MVHIALLQKLITAVELRKGFLDETHPETLAFFVVRGRHTSVLVRPEILAAHGQQVIHHHGRPLTTAEQLHAVGAYFREQRDLSVGACVAHKQRLDLVVDDPVPEIPRRHQHVDRGEQPGVLENAHRHFIGVRAAVEKHGFFRYPRRASPSEHLRVALAIPNGLFVRHEFGVYVLVGAAVLAQSRVLLCGLDVDQALLHRLQGIVAFGEVRSAEPVVEVHLAQIHETLGVTQPQFLAIGELLSLEPLQRLYKLQQPLLLALGNIHGQFVRPIGLAQLPLLDQVGGVESDFVVGGVD
mmetsp:Transcript_16018/g.27016  ORF Transcript_16018/g.27016 Transcript_16018/m.27016 type:complete len:296 (-) Transcript_16018:3042-3929(-)